jgi:hypothetical protein
MRKEGAPLSARSGSPDLNPAAVRLPESFSRRGRASRPPWTAAYKPLVPFISEDGGVGRDGAGAGDENAPGQGLVSSWVGSHGMGPRGAPAVRRGGVVPGGAAAAMSL